MIKKQFLKKSLFAICFLSFFIANAQNSNQIWDKLLRNDRKGALDLVNKLETKDDIEALFLKKIVEMENGIMQCNPDSITDLANYKDYEYYLFSNWMLPYIFNDYLNSGYHYNNLTAPHNLNANQIANSTVKNGLLYLQAVTNRARLNWDGYSKTMNKINAIKDWEYCGVYENLNDSGIDLPYPPEEYTSNTMIFDGRSKGNNKWYQSNDDDEVYQFFSNHSEYGNGIHYAQTFVHSDITQRVRLKLGKGGAIRLWLNDVLIIEDDEVYSTEMDAYTYEVTLQQGVNRLLVKLATGKTTPNFIVRLENTNDEPLTNITTSLANRNYTKGAQSIIKPEYLPHLVETYFIEKNSDTTSDANLNKLCLYFTYMRNGRIEKASAIIKKWLEVYPESSLLKSCLIECYNKLGETNISNKLKDNIVRLDPDYYISAMSKFQDTNELFKLDIETYESTLKEIGNSTNYSFMESAVELMISLRHNDKKRIRKDLDKLLEDKTLPSSIKITFVQFYSKILNDDETTITALEKSYKSEFNFSVIQYLAYYYEKLNRTEDAIQLYVDALKNISHDNNVYYSLVSLLQESNQYERSLGYIDKALENFPNSYLFNKLKGDSYVQLDNKKEAIRHYQLALKQSPSNYKIRNKINDLQGKKNPLNEFHSDDWYAYIQKNRNVIQENNYGVNELFNHTDVLNYEEGGGESRSTLIYEITSQNGVDLFKEYNLGLSGSYSINKAEIVKADGETVPAEKSGSNLVFDGLAIGDVVYIDYDERYTKTGRFYKDYVLTNYISGYHPSLKSSYRLLTKSKKVNFEVTNGVIDYKNYKKGAYYVHEWSSSNIKPLSIQEDYMPSFVDVSTVLHISSVKSWSNIANWYSDLVRKQIKLDATVQEVINQLFPEGYQHLSENERAKRIYYYITNNFNYSYVSFKQSGLIPQKPSKTITSKLGDCKDFSTLFVILAKQVKLDAQLVLILTSDYGKNEMVLPNSDFNHCIVKVSIDGKEQFLELTDKYLPYKSLPSSLRGAKALDIPMNSTESHNSTLYELNNVSRNKANVKTSYSIAIKDAEEQELDLVSSFSGHLASYYIEIFNNKELVDEKIKEDLLNRSTQKQIKLEKINKHTIDKDNGEVSFETKIAMELKIKKIGSMYMFEVPFFTNPYNNSIIELEERLYPIDYRQYENADYYEENIDITIEKNKKFIEVPESQSYQFNEHKFSISYTLIKDNHLRIKLSSNVNTKSIDKTEYAKFKEYVSQVLKVRENMIVFKNGVQ